jgi:hypothetical protein
VRIYFSGSGGLVDTPEVLVPEWKPHIMLSYLDMDRGGTKIRFDKYMERKRKYASQTKRPTRQAQPR